MIRKFNTEDFYNTEIKSEKAREYVDELQKAYDRLKSLMAQASKFFDGSEDTDCIFEYMDIKDNFLNLISSLLVYDDFQDSVYKNMTEDLNGLIDQLNWELMEEGTIGLYDVNDKLGILKLKAELDSFEVSNSQEKNLVDYAEENNLPRSIYYVLEVDEAGSPAHLLATFHYDPSDEGVTFLDYPEHSEMMYLRNVTGLDVWRTEIDQEF